MLNRVTLAAQVQLAGRAAKGARDATAAPIDADFDDEAFEAVADSTVGKLGLMFLGVPPGFVEIKSVADKSWSKWAGIVAGDLIIKVNGNNLRKMSGDDFKAALRVRPLKLLVLPEVESQPVEPLPTAKAAAPAVQESHHAASAEDHSDPPSGWNADAGTAGVDTFVGGEPPGADRSNFDVFRVSSI